MKKNLTISALLALTLFLFGSKGPSGEGDKNWPTWRGLAMNGVAPDANPPVEWNEEKNIRWKIELPGAGNSSPIIWGEHVYVSLVFGETKQPEASDPEPSGRRRRRRGIQPTEQEFSIAAINRKNGKIVWQKMLRKAVPHAGTHVDGSWAASSPVTDGEHLFAHFGSNGLYCLDMKGRLIWEKDLGNMRTRNGFGEGSSPALYDDKLIINWDHEGDSFIVCLDKRTGKEIWRKEREEVTSWSTPVVVEISGKSQVVVSATNRVRGYDLENGDLIWESGGMTTNTIPSPVYGGGVLYVASGFRGNALLAIDLAKAKGDITGSDVILWRHDQDTPYVPSPLLYGDAIYFFKRNNNILSRLDAKTGEANYAPRRIESLRGIYASPVGAAGRVYLVGRNGMTVVIKHSKTFEILAENQLRDGFDASPAITGNEIYLRGRENLYCIAEK